MRHRHLDEPGFTLAAIGDLIVRDNPRDLIELGLAMQRDGAVRDKVDRIVQARSGGESSIDHDVWRTRLALRPDRH